MRRTVLFALMIPLILAGCAGGDRDEKDWKRWQEELSAASEVSFSAEIVSLGETDAVSFSAEIRRSGERTALTVTAPETIRGVTAAVTDGERKLEYDGLILELDALREDSLAPCAAGELLLSAASEGHFLWTGRAGSCATAAFTGPGGETVTLWRSETGEIEYGEIARDGRVELTLVITDWQSKE